MDVCCITNRDDDEENNKGISFAVLILARSDRKIVLKQFPHGWWFPYARCFTCCTAHDATTHLVESMLGSQMLSQLQVTHWKTNLIYAAQTTGTVSTIFYVAKETPSVVSCLAAADVRGYRWVGLEDVQVMKGCAALLDETPIAALRDIFYSESAHPEERISEFKLRNFEKRIDPKSTEVTLLKSSGLNVERVWDMFWALCMPMVAFNLDNFKSFLDRSGVLSSYCDRFQTLFRCFDREKLGMLTFWDIMFGMASLSPHSHHGGPAGEARCRYIFRYFDSENNGALRFNDFMGMLQAIYLDRKRPSGSLENKAGEYWRNLFQLDLFNGALTLPHFLKMVGTLRFRGTSCLLRCQQLEEFLPVIERKRGGSDVTCEMSPPNKMLRVSETPGGGRHSLRNEASPSTAAEGQPIFGFLSRATQSNSIEEGYQFASPRRPNLDYSFPAIEGLVSPSGSMMAVPGHSPRRNKNLPAKVKLAMHTVRINRTGSVSSIRGISQVDGGDDGTSELNMSTASSGLEVPSSEVFNMESDAHQMLKLLRYFAKPVAGKKCYDWGNDRSVMKQFYNLLLSVCADVRKLVEKETRLVRMKAPAYILGDLHGNYRDLEFFEQALWRISPEICPSNFLFLGDYVDRGKHGVEVVAYLFAQKIVSPKTWIMLRGNHEIRSIQESFTFKNECVQKFADQGKDVWQRINAVFDRLPLAAVIDSTVFCLHGGIASPQLLPALADIDKIPCPLPDPQRESKLAWQLMWNDPFIESASNSFGRTMFMDNHLRGTGEMFTEAALNDFLAHHKLSHVIRAHQVQHAGFQVQQGGKLLTVFSSSHYCGGSNDSACVLMTGGPESKLRLIRLNINQ